MRFSRTGITQFLPVCKNAMLFLPLPLVHSYNTKAIVVDGRRVEVAVSRQERPHLTFSSDKKFLYLNLRNLAEDLKRVLRHYETELRADAGLRDKFFTSIRSEREQHVIDPVEKVAWEELLD